LSGFEKFKELASINIIRGLLFFPFLIIGTLLEKLNGTLIAYSLVVLVIFFVYQYFIHKFCGEYHIRLDYRITSSFAKQLLNLSIPTFLSGSIITIMMWLSNTLLVRTPNGYSEMGLFNAVLQWRTIMIYIPNILGQVMLPILSNLLGIQNVKAYLKTCFNNSLIVTFLSLFLGVPIIIFSNTIMKLYGETFVEGSNSLKIIVVSTIIYSIGSILGLIISSTGKMWIGLLINIIWALAFLYFLYQGNPITSNSLSYAYLYSYLVHLFSVTIVSYLIIKSILNYRV